MSFTTTTGNQKNVDESSIIWISLFLARFYAIVVSTVVNFREYSKNKVKVYNRMMYKENLGEYFSKAFLPPVGLVRTLI